MATQLALTFQREMTSNKLKDGPWSETTIQGKRITRRNTKNYPVFPLAISSNLHSLPFLHWEADLKAFPSPRHQKSRIFIQLRSSPVARKPLFFPTCFTFRTGDRIQQLEGSLQILKGWGFEREGLQRENVFALHQKWKQAYIWELCHLFSNTTPGPKINLSAQTGFVICPA